MNDTRTEPLFESIENLAREMQGEGAHASPWMVHVARAGVVVALLGGVLGGASTIYEMWREATAKPNVVIVTGNALTVSWNRKQRNLSFSRRITVENNGEVIGVVANPPRVRLESSPTEVTELVEIQAEERGGAVGFPMSVRPSDSRDVLLTMSLTVPDADTVFIKEGTYRLYLSLDTPSTPTPDVSCIRFTKQLISEINEAGSIRISTPESCETGIGQS